MNRSTDARCQGAALRYLVGVDAYGAFELNQLCLRQHMQRWRRTLRSEQPVSVSMPDVDQPFHQNG